MSSPKTKTPSLGLAILILAAVAAMIAATVLVWKVDIHITHTCPR